MKFNEIKTRNDLANLIEVPKNKLTYVLYILKVDSQYTDFEIPKKSGGKRTISSPRSDLKSIQRSLSNSLVEYEIELSKEKNKRKVSHGFEKERSIITNSQAHRNKRFVCNMDIENFFESFHFGRIRGFFEKNNDFLLPREVATVIAQICCYKGKLPQGAPTSPVITNFICRILDMRIISIAQKYKLDYTRYADDLTFSTNDKFFLVQYGKFVESLKKEVCNFGLEINDKKTRLQFKSSRQEVTGLVVNNRVNVKREFYKHTRAMAYKQYTTGEFEVNDEKGSLNQLEGRFSFINMLEKENNKGKNKSLAELSNREKDYKKFLFYKNFIVNKKPLIMTEGKTDISYLKSALKKHYKDYPNLITKSGKGFQFHITFFNRTSKFKYFFGLQKEGADTLTAFYQNYYFDSKKDRLKYPNYGEYFKNCGLGITGKPIIYIFDNEIESSKPLKKFMNVVISEKIKNEEDFVKVIKDKLYVHVEENIYVLTNPLIGEKLECEIEELFEPEILNKEIGGKKFSRASKIDTKKEYGKEIFSDYVKKNYENIDFSKFIPMLNSLNEICILK